MIFTEPMVIASPHLTEPDKFSVVTPVRFSLTTIVATMKVEMNMLDVVRPL